MEHNLLVLIQDWLADIALSKAKTTRNTYGAAMNTWLDALKEAKLSRTLEDGTEAYILTDEQLNERLLLPLFRYIQKHDFSTGTERNRSAAVCEFLRDLSSKDIGTLNEAKLRVALRTKSRKLAKREKKINIPVIEGTLEYCAGLITAELHQGTERERRYEYLRNLRDRALFLTLCFTGLRVSEVVQLKWGDVISEKAFVIGKGNTEKRVWFNKAATEAIMDYVTAREGAAPDVTHFVFTGHGKQDVPETVDPMATKTARAIVEMRAWEKFGPEAYDPVTKKSHCHPHALRHYCTTRLIKSTGNLELVRLIMGWRNIQTAQRYAHLDEDDLAKGYHGAMGE